VLVTAVGVIVWVIVLPRVGTDLSAALSRAGWARACPGSAYIFSWYGGIYPASYSLLALAGTRLAMAVAAVVTAALLADTVIRQTSQTAAYWHQAAQQYPPPTPKEKATAERIGGMGAAGAATARLAATWAGAWLPSQSGHSIHVTAGANGAGATRPPAPPHVPHHLTCGGPGHRGPGTCHRSPTGPPASRRTAHPAGTGGR
jgi:hypothetical protein